MPRYCVSFQLYSSRRFPPIESQLDILSGIGFDAVETYGDAYGSDAPGFRRKLDDRGLACPSAHIALDLLDSDRGSVIAIARALGAETVVAPNIAPDRRPTTVAGWRALSQSLADHARALIEEGLRLAWHNHDFEFRPLRDGSRPIDHILAATGVLFEADIGMMARAGVDPANELIKFADRLVALHVKDVAGETTNAHGGWTDIGAGTQNWTAIWPAIAASRADLLVFEHDDPADFRRFAENSYRYVRRQIEE